jgi:hypothetical protein
VAKKANSAYMAQVAKRQGSVLAVVLLEGGRHPLHGELQKSEAVSGGA